MERKGATTLRDLPLYTLEQGERGAPVLLLHGFGASTATWSRVVEPLAAGHTVMAVDLLGFGRSAKPADADYGLHAQAERILHLIRARDLKDLTLVGHSMGGGVALLVALALQEQSEPRLRRLVLIDSIGCLQLPPLFIAALCLPLLGPALAQRVPAGWAVRAVLQQVYFDYRKIQEDLVEAYAAPLRGEDGRRARAALVAAARRLLPLGLRRRLRRAGGLRVPILLLRGEQDRIVPSHVARCLLDALPTARLVVIEACGHAPQEECPDRTLAIVEPFLRDG